MALFACGKKEEDVTSASDVSESTVIAETEPALLGPEEVVSHFIDGVASGDVENAYGKYADPQLKSLSQDEVYSSIEVAYYSHMTYETELVSEDDQGTVVKVYGTAPDIKAAVNSVYATDNATAIMAEMILLEGDDNAAKISDPKIKQLMTDIIVKYINENEPVVFEKLFTLAKDTDGIYKIIDTDQMPEITWNEGRFSDEQLTAIMRDALEILVSAGRITDEKYDDVYKKLFSKQEALAAVESYISGVIRSDRGKAQSEVAAAYYDGLTYNLNVTNTSGNRITVVITGTVPDVKGAVDAATSDSSLTSIMITAAYTAMNAGSIDAGRSVAESMVRDKFYSEVGSRGRISFSSTVYVTMDKDGKYIVSASEALFPSMPGSLSLNVSSGRLQACARSALASLLANGAITQEEYDRYVGQIGAYL